MLWQIIGIFLINMKQTQIPTLAGIASTGNGGDAVDALYSIAESIKAIGRKTGY